VAERAYEVAFHHEYGGQPFVTTWAAFGDDVSGQTPSDAQDIAAHYGGSAALTTAFAAMVPTAGTLLTCVATEIIEPGSGDVPSQGVHSINKPGTHPVDSAFLPDPMCTVISKHTDAAVRSGHGWMFTPPIGTATAINDEVAAPSWLALVQAFIDEMNHFNKGGSAWSGSIPWIDPSTWGNAVYSRTRHQQQLAQYLFHIVGFTARSPITWLRSRRRLSA
jgi:hypothetical protein